MSDNSRENFVAPAPTSPAAPATTSVPGAVAAAPATSTPAQPFRPRPARRTPGYKPQERFREQEEARGYTRPMPARHGAHIDPARMPTPMQPGGGYTGTAARSPTGVAKVAEALTPAAGTPPPGFEVATSASGGQYWKPVPTLPTENMSFMWGGAQRPLEDQVRSLYTQYGNMNPDAEGLAYWQQRLAAGEDITGAFRDSANYVLNRG